MKEAKKMKQVRPYTYIKDKEKMKDFLKLNKEDFLKSYSYLYEEEYDATVWEYIKHTRNAYKRQILNA
jgi:hypothetical protein